MNSAEQKIIRGEPIWICVVAIFFLPLLLAGLVMLFVFKDQLLIGLILCGLYPLSIYWKTFPEVILSNDSLIYRALFMRRTIDLSLLTRVTVTSARKIELYTADSTGVASLTFSVRLFDTNDIACILKHIGRTCPSAHLDTSGLVSLRANLHQDKYIIIGETVIDEILTGIDFYSDPFVSSGEVAVSIHYWEFMRNGPGSSGMFASPSEILAEPKSIRLIKKAGAEWFLPILERLRDGELVSDEEIEALANQHRG